MDLRDLEVILFNWISILMTLFHFDTSTIITVYYVLHEKITTPSFAY